MAHRSGAVPCALFLAASACSNDSVVLPAGSSPASPGAPPSSTRPVPPPPANGAGDCHHRNIDPPAGWVLDYSGSHCPLYAVVATGPTDVWIGGDNGSLYRWNGTEFQRQWAGAGVNIREFWASGPRDVWAGGTGLLHFDGDRWRQVDSPIQGEVRALGGSGPNDVWLLDSGGGVWHWTNGSWSLQALTGKATSLAVAGPSDVWVGASSVDGHALLVHWDGRAWTPWQTQAPGFVSSLAALAGDEVWALVSNEYAPPASMVGVTDFSLYRFDGTGWVAEPY